MTPGPTDPHPLVRIHYLRPPDRLEVFEQRTLASDASVIVTFAEAMHRAPAMELEGEVVLESGSDVVWFTFPDEWHDIGRFHTADGVFKGFYANILTPPEIRPDHVWHTTDLFLDVWLSPGRRPLLLDEDQLGDAVAEGWVDLETARRARQEAARIVEEAGRGSWPPRVVHEWTRERARATLGRG